MYLQKLTLEIWGNSEGLNTSPMIDGGEGNGAKAYKDRWTVIHAWQNRGLLELEHNSFVIGLVHNKIRIREEFATHKPDEIPS